VKVGDRVTVRLVVPSEYATGAAEQLDGRAGTIENASISGNFCVRFDEPCKPWWKDQSPPKAWWFSPKELAPS
jgi:hypothetical protein